MTNQSTSRNILGRWAIGGVSRNSDHSLPIHTPGRMLVTQWVFFPNSFSQPFSFPGKPIHFTGSQCVWLSHTITAVHTKPKLPMTPPTSTPTIQAEPLPHISFCFMTYQRVITSRKVMIPLYSVICVLCPVWGRDLRVVGALSPEEGNKDGEKTENHISGEADKLRLFKL